MKYQRRLSADLLATCQEGPVTCHLRGQLLDQICHMEVCPTASVAFETATDYLTVFTAVVSERNAEMEKLVLSSVSVVYCVATFAFDYFSEFTGAWSWF